MKYGVCHPEFSDIPLGGWSGTIDEIEPLDDKTVYGIDWDRRTLAAMHPIFLKRCERDDFVVETSWLDDDSIEPDDGASVQIEKPTKIITPPLSEKNQDDRVRKVFGLTHDDPIPAISDESLLAYHRYLIGKLKFPFTALYDDEEEIGPFSRKRPTMRVTELVDPEDEALTEEDGLRCKAHYRDEEIEERLSEIEVKRKDPNYKWVDDYGYWFHNWPCLSDSHDMGERLGRDAQTLVAGPSEPATVTVLFVFGVVGGILGAAIGAAFLTFRAAILAATIAGIPAAMIGALLLGRYGRIFGSVVRARLGGLLGASMGLVIGATFGVFAGLLILAFPWSLLGIVAGLVMAKFLVPGTVLRLLMGTILGPSFGILFASFRQDGDRAIVGALAGSIVGLVAGAGLPLALIGLVPHCRACQGLTTISARTRRMRSMTMTMTMTMSTMIGVGGFGDLEKRRESSLALRFIHHQSHPRRPGSRVHCPLERAARSPRHGYPSGVRDIPWRPFPRSARRRGAGPVLRSRNPWSWLARRCRSGRSEP